MEENQSTCKRCGNCCENGGPALHKEDKERIRSGEISLSSLITIRKGELAHNPVSNKIQPVSVELVKLVGTGRQWNCCYYDSEKGCLIYDQRPYACRVLKCWEPDELLQIVEKNTISRFDILGSDNPIVEVIEEHERVCPYDDLGEIFQKGLQNLTPTKKKALEKRLRADLRFRARVVEDFKLKVSEELFYFGRPLFQILQPLGCRIFESSSGIEVKW